MNADRQHDVGQEGNKIGSETYPKLCAALYKFLCRSYFKRIWIVQEVAISTEPLIVVDSGKAVSFGSLDASAYNLQAMIAFNPVLRSQMAEADPELEPKDLSYERLIFVRKLFYFRHLMAGGAPLELLHRPAVRPGSPGFLEAAVLTRDFEATDERGKIFALWNLAKTKMAQSSRWTMARALRWSFSISRPHGQGSMVASTSLPFPNLTGALRFTREWSFTNHKIYENQEPSPYKDLLQAAVSMFHGDVPSAWKLRGVDPDKVDNIDNPSDDDKYKTAWHRYDCMTEKSRHIPKNRSLSVYERGPWLDVVHAVLRGRVLCITKKRYMALLPSHVADNDSGKPWLLAILATCSVPVLLQEAGILGGKTTYRLGGACFVQGWMEGEVLERPGLTRSPAEFWFTEEGKSNTLRII
ncbi:hypothetical protein LZ31DRAFT_544417 [Colletotrichum somersetense]|nr:hypothetical protein LZ31DRAFT_544417 [Colletotrichum somersetense]